MKTELKIVSSVHEETPVGINQSNICDNFKIGASRYCGDKAADIIKEIFLSPHLASQKSQYTTQ